MLFGSWGVWGLERGPGRQPAPSPCSLATWMRNVLEGFVVFSKGCDFIHNMSLGIVIYFEVSFLMPSGHALVTICTQTFRNRQVKARGRGWHGPAEVTCLRVFCTDNFSPVPSRYLTSLLLQSPPKYWLMVFLSLPSLGPGSRTLCGIPEDQWLPECDLWERHLSCHRVLGVSEARALPRGGLCVWKKATGIGSAGSDSQWATRRAFLFPSLVAPSPRRLFSAVSLLVVHAE